LWIFSPSCEEWFAALRVASPDLEAEPAVEIHDLCPIDDNLFDSMAPKVLEACSE
jgi:hypothetical protein